EDDLRVARECTLAFASVREPVLLLDGELRVQQINRAFTDTFAVSPAETVGRPIFELGDGQWEVPALRELLHDLQGKRTSFEGFVVEHDFPRIGRRTMVVDARRIESGRARDHLIVVVIREANARAPAQA